MNRWQSYHGARNGGGESRGDFGTIKETSGALFRLGVQKRLLSTASDDRLAERPAEEDF